MKDSLSTGGGKRLTIAALVAVAVAIPTIAAPQDLTTLLAIFLRNLHAGRIVIPQQTTFAALPTIQDGVIVYCSDCAEGADPATGSSTGAFALRMNGRWLTLDGGGGSVSGAPDDAEYWTGAANATLTAEKNLGALSTALVLNTAGTPSAYTGIDCTNQFPRDISGAGVGTCASVSLANDITGTLGIGSGGTGQTTKTAAFNALADGSVDGDLMVYNGSNWVRVAPGAIGQFLRVNTFASPALEWATGPNVADQDSDASNSSNVTFTNLTDLNASPAVDTWVRYECSMMYQTAANTTGITIGLFVNNVGATAAPQYLNAKWTFGGNAAAGTLSATSDLMAYTTASLGTLTTAGVNAGSTWYNLRLEALILTHATESGTLIFPIYRSEVNTSAVTIKEGSSCIAWVLHVDS